MTGLLSMTATLAQDLQMNDLEYFECQGVNVRRLALPVGAERGYHCGNTQYVIFGSSFKNIVNK